MAVTEDGKSTGIFYSPEGKITLFLSKKSAEQVLKELGYKVSLFSELHENIC